MAERSGDALTNALTDLLEMQATAMFRALFTEPIRQAAMQRDAQRTAPKACAMYEAARLEHEARILRHRELVDYYRALSDAHPDWPASRIAESAARVFAAGAAQPPPEGEQR
jgi:hypothetical protein